ncbi:IS1380 family transposase [Asticcacaulis excentricus]|uniref:Transposase IS4 family protein n=1 Tax=Asticcacaulis excentricus (strain ATCC 15261 / DSM 4724 / KCTC 12464 / NCIMB 9791 / VKM B-1370 / CB 48) TaxID=573065 RepID=E8RUP0_ASTEC|nr:IS1380 family transposase [Asticcacaulis excentricus]ADU14090.1 transposase IS4 family protein [Asticcacaulis excentricus CB 48]ADU15256.1 transposase IS4 family protein [Asticcacaulis excentricus CB 48]
MDQDTDLPFDLPSVSRKKITAAFDGGRISSDGGVMLLSAAERRIGIIDRLWRLIPDRRNPFLVTHSLASILKARVFAIACGYEDGNDLAFLRTDPAFKLACGRLPEGGKDLCSQPTLSRLENAPDLRSSIKLTYGLIDQYCASFGSAVPAAVTLDIDDTVDVVHGRQQLSLFNAHEGEYVFKPIHVYDVSTGRPVVVILRPGKTPSGKEVRGWVRRMVRQIRKHWPTTHITLRGDGHYARPEVMAWAEHKGVDYIFGLAGSKPLHAKVEAFADHIRVVRAEQDAAAVRGYTEVRHGAKSWGCERRVIARIEATPMGLDNRFVVTSLTDPDPETLYAKLYCARGNAENLIKLHKTQLKSDRTSCRCPLANQMRLILHTAAYWLMLAVRDQIPKAHKLATAEFNTIRLRLLKIGARIKETAHRVRIAFAAACPEASLLRHIMASLKAAPA